MLKQIRRGIRLAQIADLVIKHGLGSILDFIGFRPRGIFRGSSDVDRDQSLPTAHRVRLLLQDLGPTFIKLGQIASTRNDVFGDDFVRELRKLQDSNTPISFQEVAQVIQESLGKPIDQIYADFEPDPIAAASIGQVHRARMPDGRRVAVKVQRPGVEELIREDMGILRWAARRVEARLEIARRIQLSDLLDEFESLLMDELVYTMEGHNADRMRQNMRDSPLILIPEVVWESTGRRVLTLQDVTGIKLTDRSELEAAGINLPNLAVALSKSYMKQILVDGFFHGDPHQGNFFVGPDSRIALVDFGIMGRLDERTRDTLVDMFIAVFRQDSEAAVQYLVSLGATSLDTDMIALNRDVDRILSKYYFLPRQEFRIGEVMSHVLTVVHRHDVHMPTELALLVKVLLTIEGICLQLDPAYDFNAAVKPFAVELMRKSSSPEVMMQEMARNARELGRMAHTVPTQLLDLLNKADKGRLRVIVQYDHSDRSLDHLHEIANRLAISICLSAMLTGSAILMHAHVAGILGYAGYILSFMFLCWMLVVMVWGLPPHRRIPPRRSR